MSVSLKIFFSTLSRQTVIWRFCSTLSEKYVILKVLLYTAGKVRYLKVLLYTVRKVRYSEGFALHCQKSTLFWRFCSTLPEKSLKLNAFLYTVRKDRYFEVFFSTLSENSLFEGFSQLCQKSPLFFWRFFSTLSEKSAIFLKVSSHQQNNIIWECVDYWRSLIFSNSVQTSGQPPYFQRVCGSG